MMRHLGMALLALGVLALAGNAQEKKAEPKTIKTDSGLQYQDLKEGTGDKAKKDDVVEVHYTGWLATGGSTATPFDPSIKRKRPLTSTLAAGDVIKACDAGVAGL